jgi:geranylgeranyl diphosphate synthase type II
MHSSKYLQQLIESEIASYGFKGKPDELYEPIHYTMMLGGKRMRPVLYLLAHQMFGGDPHRSLLPALGIEVFHNFTLLHDDIMDNAPLRRAKETVHKKWNADIAILSGDTMFVQACQLLSRVDEKYLRQTLDIFFKTAIEVCEGQQIDMNFEKMPDVTSEQYLEMIRLKTAVLLGCSLQLGALTAGASEHDQRHLYSFGENTGIAFQLLDDILDVYGDEVKFGKQVGGDIISNKKTMLLITALSEANPKQKVVLDELLNAKNFDPAQKVASVKNIYDELSIREKTTSRMEKYFHKAMTNLNAIETDPQLKQPLIELAEKLMVRES